MPTVGCRPMPEASTLWYALPPLINFQELFSTKFYAHFVLVGLVFSLLDKNSNVFDLNFDAFRVATATLVASIFPTAFPGLNNAC